jgi:hypothetical protein
MIRQLLSLPLVRAAEWLLFFAAVIPLVGGVFARIVVFGRDDDDVRRLSSEEATKVAQERARSHSDYEPEPDPVYSEPWPDARSSMPFQAVDTGRQAIVRNIDDEVRPEFTYVGRVPDRTRLTDYIEELWRSLAKSPKSRTQWALSDALWNGPSPFALGGAQGASPDAATLTVDIGVPAGTSEYEALKEIWEMAVVPELRGEFGYDAFANRQ